MARRAGDRIPQAFPSIRTRALMRNKHHFKEKEPMAPPTPRQRLESLDAYSRLLVATGRKEARIDTADLRLLLELAVASVEAR